MELSAELFGQIIRQLKGSLSDDKDKRNAPRVGLRNQVRMATLNAATESVGATELVRVRNLSLQGIGILHHVPLDIGSEFMIQLALRNRPDVCVVYIVRHCDLLTQGFYGIGGSLHRVIDPNKSDAAKPELAPTPIKAEDVAKTHAA